VKYNVFLTKLLVYHNYINCFSRL